MPLKTSLISYWKCDEASGNLVDAHGSNTGVETSGTIASMTGKIGNARDYEAGDTEYHEVTHTSALNVGPDNDFSIACWVNLESKGSIRTIIAKGNPGSFTLGEFFLIYNSNLDRWQFSVLKSPGTQTNAITTTSPPTATWVFLECGHDSTNNLIWISVNGGTRVTASHSTGANTTTTNLFIGRDPAALSWYWDGGIDELCVWQKCITTTEVAEIYNGGSGKGYDLWDLVYSETGTGGARCGGSASVAVRYAVTPTGGSVAGGSGLNSCIYRLTPSGGASCGGSSGSWVVYRPSPAGGVVCGGGLTQTYTEPSSGGTRCGGSGGSTVVYRITPAGGAVSSGFGLPFVIGSHTGAGGAVCGGSGLPFVSRTLTGTGGASCGGSSTTLAIFWPGASGGAVVSGGATVALIPGSTTYNEIMLGGVRCGGAARGESSTYDHTMSGGVLCGGRVKPGRPDIAASLVAFLRHNVTETPSPETDIAKSLVAFLVANVTDAPPTTPDIATSLISFLQENVE